MPDDIKNALHEIRTKLPNPAMKFNSCLISRYRSGDNFIAPHRYDKPNIYPDSHDILYGGPGGSHFNPKM